jgi:hypothetical protein
MRISPRLNGLSKITTVVAAAVLSAGLSGAGLSGQTSTVGMAESSIRRIATSKPMPVYPAESLAAKRTGVAVAAIASAPDGRVTRIIVLEAPDEATGAAVQDALSKWVIPPATVAGRPQPYGVQGKVTFYFRIESGRGRVSNPEDLPGGPKPEPPGGPPKTPPGTRRGGEPGAPRPAPMVMNHAPAADIEIGDAELKTLLATERPTFLDVRERNEFTIGHRDGAINIPYDELAARSFIEIDRAKPLVIDCSRTDTAICHLAAHTLLGGPQFARVFVFLP